MTWASGSLRSAKKPGRSLNGLSRSAPLTSRGRGGCALVVRLRPARGERSSRRLDRFDSFEPMKIASGFFCVALLLFSACAGKGSLPAPPTGGSGSDEPRIGDPAGEWRAWVDLMPPGPATLHVTGEVWVPHPIYRVKLIPRAPQGINPRDLILDLYPAFDGIQQVGRAKGHYRQEAGTGFDTVTVRFPDGTSRTFDVEEAL